LVWIFPFRQISGKGQFLTLRARPTDEKKSTDAFAQVLDSELQNSVVGRE